MLLPKRLGVVAFEHLVGSDIQHHAVRMRTARAPVPRGPAVLHGLAHEGPIAGRHQSLRHGVVQIDEGCPACRMVDARKQQIAAAAPQRCVDPRRLSVRRLEPGGAAFPRRALGKGRCARVDDLRFDGGPRRDRPGQFDAQLPLRIRILRGRDLAAVDVDAVDRELRIQIERELATAGSKCAASGSRCFRSFALRERFWWPGRGAGNPAPTARAA